MQFHSTINKWHTSKNTAPINASNPCSEYMFLDDSACNLSSLNLMKFLNPDGKVAVEAFRQAVDILIMAQEIIVDNASYPTDKIAQNSHDFRPLGLGYANLGALLMASGLPYDSDAGRDMAAAITAVMHGQAYLTSSRIAAEIGSCPGFAANRDPFLAVIAMHRNALQNINPRNVSDSLWEASKKVWDDCLASGMKYGYRNAQVTVLAPTGTIGFMMDCDTTGIEPDLALVKHKKLVGGGLIKIVNNCVPQALMKLGYPPEEAAQIVAYIDQTGKIEDAPGLKPEHLPVFDCSLTPAGGGRSIAWRGHLRMMAAAQPFLSGAISKTINMPEEATLEDIMQAYVESWKLGLKAVAIYRDNSKRSQPLSAAGAKKEEPGKPAQPAAEQQELFHRAQRRKLPSERKSITHKFSIGNHEGYLTVGMYEDGTPGEIFIKMAKEGSTLSGFMDGFALSVSIGLQYGVPLKALVDKLINTRFEPSGYTGNPEIRFASSVLDYIARWLGGKFISAEYLKLTGLTNGEMLAATALPPVTPESAEPSAGRSSIAPDAAHICSNCGMLMTPNGSCYKCENCGNTSGCS
jgi:ribonucleoside-diphosphate reductase alpha chain